MPNLITTKMTARRILAIIFTAFICAEARFHDHNHQKREVPSICNPTYNEATKVQCYCVKDAKEADEIRSADCYLTSEEVPESDISWDDFADLKTLHKLTFANTRGISLDYFPSKALKHTHQLRRLDIKYGSIQTVHSFAFANLSSLEEISLRDTQVQVLAAHAFAHHRDLKVINLDKNNIVEINRDVFIDLPSLEKLYLTSNKLTTIHDRAFIHLNNLKELELNMNKLFSLNSETFSGLKKLQKLDLSGNTLDVIGDNTFAPLKNLHTLNLEGNKIQMLDKKSFNGLVNLRYLNLAHNKLSTIDNDGVFEGLQSLMSLSFRGNEIQELKPKLMAPILDNLYKADASLDLEDTSFPCDCKLEWFVKLMNKTLSKNLKITLENLKCIPDDNTKEIWSKIEENDKTNSQTFDEDNASNGGDYEYYDGSQLDGKLFYTDVRSIINCTKTQGSHSPFKTIYITPKIDSQSRKTEKTAAKSELYQNVLSTAKPAPATSKTGSEENTIVNHGVLDLSQYETTVKSEEGGKNTNVNEINQDKKSDSYTTSRLATVSANPIENRNMHEDNMASDEAIPDKFKAHRSVKEELKSSSNINVECLSLILLTLLFCFS